MVKYFILLTLLFFASIPAAAQEGQELIFGKYNPTADPNQQLSEAINEATKLNKRIILDVGGEWCIWCHRLDTLFMKNPDLTEYLKENFVLIKINFSKENDNEQFLSQFPKVAGYPHLFVLESDGTLLHSQDTGKLEKGKGHDKDKVKEFLKLWTKKE